MKPYLAYRIVELFRSCLFVQLPPPLRYMLGNFLLNSYFFGPWQFSNFMVQLIKISIELSAWDINHNEELAQTHISWTSAFNLFSCSACLSEISMRRRTIGFSNYELTALDVCQDVAPIYVLISDALYM